MAPGGTGGRTGAGDAAVLETIELGAGITVLATGRDGRSGADPFAGNLADHVGDDPVAVQARRQALADRLRRERGATADAFFLRADHGVALVEVAQDASGKVRTFGPAPDRFDLALTASPGLPLAALSADCVPFVVADVDGGRVLVGHAGWRGTAAAALTVAVDALRSRGGRSAAMAVVLGPAACGACYEVGPEVAERLAAPAAGGGDPARWAVQDGPRWRVDLRSHLAHQAVSSGVGPERIVVSSRCTMTDRDLFSHRRDGRVGPTGRQGLVVVRSAS